MAKKRRKEITEEEKKKKNRSLEFTDKTLRKIKYIQFLKLCLVIKYNNPDSKPHCTHLKPPGHRKRRVVM